MNRAKLPLDQSTSNMKILICIVVVLVTQSNGYSHLGLLRSLVDGTPGISLYTISRSDERCDQPRECLNCTAAKICLPNGVVVGQIDCATFNPKLPYCNGADGTCTATASDECLPTEDKFFCPADGIFPDPSNCRKFHYCLGTAEKSINCPPNNVYDHDQQTCKLQRRPSDCATFNCVGKEGQYVLYPKDDRIWATCAAGKAYIMGRCKDYEKFDLTTGKCVRVCKQVQNQPIEDTCDSYVRCAEIAPGKLEPVEFPCPPSQGFDPVTLECSSTAACLTQPAEEAEDNDEDSGNETQKENEDESKNVEGKSLLRINSSGNDNSNNNVTNGNDDVNGNLVNGNDNGNNNNSGNVGSGNTSGSRLLRINSSGNGNSNNSVTNGNDSVNGNLVNGNGNGNNSNTGDVGSGIVGGRTPFRINSSGNNNSNNNVENGDDDTNGNLINGNGNSGNTNQGDVGSGKVGGRLLGRINSSGNNNSNNNVENGNDDTNGNLINGNGNSGNTNQGDVGSGNMARLLARINSSGNSNVNNTVANGNDNHNGNIVNGNGNSNNSNSGDTGSENSSGQGNQLIVNGEGIVNGNLVNGNNNRNTEDWVNVNSDNHLNNDNGNSNDEPQSLLDLIVHLIQSILHGGRQQTESNSEASDS